MDDPDLAWTLLAVIAANILVIAIAIVSARLGISALIEPDGPS
jgi:hypothetical protein